MENTKSNNGLFHMKNQMDKKSALSQEQKKEKRRICTLWGKNMRKQLSLVKSEEKVLKKKILLFYPS